MEKLNKRKDTFKKFYFLNKTFFERVFLFLVIYYNYLMKGIKALSSFQERFKHSSSESEK